MPKYEQITSDFVIKQQDSNTPDPIPVGSVGDSQVIAGIQGIKISGVAAGSVIFTGAAPNYAFTEDNAHLFWDDTNNLFGIGTNAPTGVLSLANSTPASVATTPGTAATAMIVITGTQGGDTTIATTGIGGVGAAVSWNAGTGGQATAAATISTGGAGGATNHNGGTGGAAAVAGTGANNGGNGGQSLKAGGAGGAATGATSGTNTGGNGGLSRILGGNGGAASGSSTLNIAGNGGTGTTQGGNGGAASGTAANSQGGIGGALNITSGNGGANSSTAGIKIGGLAGALNLNGGTGGSVTGTGTSNTAGAGADIVIVAGQGGAASGGTTNAGGNGGYLYLRAGVGGVGTQTTGNNGPIVFYSGANQVGYWDYTGDLRIGDQFSVANGLRNFDVYNLSTTNVTDGVIYRLITKNVANTTTTTGEIYKRMNGQMSIWNNETNTAAYMSFGVGASERLRITSNGVHQITSSEINVSGVLISTTGTSAGTGASISLANSASGGGSFFMSATDTGWGAGANKLIIGTGSQPQSSNAKIYLDGANGNVGIGANSSGGVLEATRNQNATTSLNVINTTSGTGARAQILWGAGSGGVYGFLTHNSAAFTTSGIDQASSTSLQGADTGGLILGATNASAGIKFFAANAEKARIDSLGNLLINDTTSNATNAKLQVSGTTGVTTGSSSDEATFLIKATGNNQRFAFGTNVTGTLYSWMQSSQPGGAGPAVPIVLNPLGGAVSIGKVPTSGYIVTAVGTSATTSFERYNASAGAGAALDLAHSKNATIGSHTAVASADNLGRVGFLGSDGTAFQLGAQINGEVDGTVSSGIVPGRLVFLTSNTSGTTIERMRIDSIGTVTVGTATAPNGTHIFRNNSTTNTSFQIINTDTTTSSDGISNLTLQKGSVTSSNSQVFIQLSSNAGGQAEGRLVAGAAGSHTPLLISGSDRRLKKNIVPLSSLDKILALNPVHWDWKDDTGRSDGFIAQDLIEIFPDMVFTTDDGEGEELPEGTEPWQLGYATLVPHLVSAIKELKAEKDVLQAEKDALEAIVNSFEARLAALEA